MNLRTRITDLLGSKKLRSSTLAAVAALSWITWSALPGMAVSDHAESLAGISFSPVDGAYAEVDTNGATAPAGNATTPAATTDKSAAGATVVNGLIEAVMMLFLPATFIAGWLLSPDWTFGEIFGLRPIIHSLWVLISNVVYVVFAFLLVAMAFMNIFWQWGDHYAMKKALPRFVTGILIVPFTWFIVSGVLSISNLLTASVLRLPADILDKTIVSWNAAKSENEPTFNMPNKCTLSFDKLKQWAASAGSGAAASAERASDKAAKFFSCEGSHEVTFRQAMEGRWTYGILNLYAYDIFKVDQIKKIDGVNLKSVGSVVDIILTVGLWGFFLIVYALLMLALCFALITRAFYLWIIAIFSPLFGLFYYMEGKGKIAESMKNLSFTSFISLALVPVYVSAALGFGLLFLKMAENAEIAPENSSFFNTDSKTEDATQWNATFVMGSDKTKTTIEVKWFPVGQTAQKAAWAAGAVAKGWKWLVKLAASSIGKIIVQILGIVVLWMAVMVALKSNEITAEAVKPISDFGSSMGKLAMDMPKYVPIPLGKGEDGKERKLSMAWLGSMGQGISSAISSSAISQGSEMGQKFGAWVAEALGMASNKNVLALQRINEQMKNTTDPTQVARLTREALANTWATSSEDLMKKPIEKEKLIAALSSARPEVFTDHKAAKHALEEMKKATTSSAFRDEFDKFNAQIKGQKIGSYESVTEFDEVLKQSSSNQAGNHSQTQSSTAAPTDQSNIAQVPKPASPTPAPAPATGGGAPGSNGQT